MMKKENIRIHGAEPAQDGRVRRADCPAGSAREHFIPDHPGDRQCHGRDRLRRSGRGGKSLCIHHADIIRFYAVHVWPFVAQNYGAGRHMDQGKEDALHYGVAGFL